MWRWMTEAGVVTSRPCVLTEVVLCPTADVVAHVTLYNGLNASDEVIQTIRTGAGNTKAIHYKPGLELGHGLYINIVDTLDGVLLVWEHVEPKWPVGPVM